MKRLKDSNARLLLISVAILAALFGLVVLGRNLYRAHYARQQVWPEFNPEDYALASIEYRYYDPAYSFAQTSEIRLLTEDHEIAALCRLLNENHGKWTFHSWEPTLADRFWIQLVRSKGSSWDTISISFYENMAATQTAASRFSGGFPVDPGLKPALMELYDAGLSINFPSPTPQQLRGATFSYLYGGKTVSSHPVAAEDLTALCDILAELAEQAVPSNDYVGMSYTGLQLVLELENTGFTFSFNRYGNTRYLRIFNQHGYTSRIYQLPEGCDPFAALGFPVQAPSAP